MSESSSSELYVQLDEIPILSSLPLDIWNRSNLHVKSSGPKIDNKSSNLVNNEDIVKPVENVNSKIIEEIPSTIPVNPKTNEIVNLMDINIHDSTAVSSPNEVKTVNSVQPVNPVDLPQTVNETTQLVTPMEINQPTEVDQPITPLEPLTPSVPVEQITLDAETNKNDNIENKEILVDSTVVQSIVQPVILDSSIAKETTKVEEEKTLKPSHENILEIELSSSDEESSELNKLSSMYKIDKPTQLLTLDGLHNDPKQIKLMNYIQGVLRNSPAAQEQIKANKALPTWFQDATLSQQKKSSKHKPYRGKKKASKQYSRHAEKDDSSSSSSESSSESSSSSSQSSKYCHCGNHSDESSSSDCTSSNSSTNDCTNSNSSASDCTTSNSSTSFNSSSKDCTSSDSTTSDCTSSNSSTSAWKRSSQTCDSPNSSRPCNFSSSLRPCDSSSSLKPCDSSSSSRSCDSSSSSKSCDYSSIFETDTGSTSTSKSYCKCHKCSSSDNSSDYRPCDSSSSNECDTSSASTSSSDCGKCNDFLNSTSTSSSDYRKSSSSSSSFKPAETFVSNTAAVPNSIRTYHINKYHQISTSSKNNEKDEVKNEVVKNEVVKNEVKNEVVKNEVVKNEVVKAEVKNNINDDNKEQEQDHNQVPESASEPESDPFTYSIEIRNEEPSRVHSSYSVELQYVYANDVPVDKLKEFHPYDNQHSTTEQSVPGDKLVNPEDNPYRRQPEKDEKLLQSKQLETNKQTESELSDDSSMLERKKKVKQSKGFKHSKNNDKEWWDNVSAELGLQESGENFWDKFSEEFKPKPKKKTKLNQKMFSLKSEKKNNAQIKQSINEPSPASQLNLIGTIEGHESRTDLTDPISTTDNTLNQNNVKANDVKQTPVKKNNLVQSPAQPSVQQSLQPLEMSPQHSTEIYDYPKIARQALSTLEAESDNTNLSSSDGANDNNIRPILTIKQRAVLGYDNGDDSLESKSGVMDSLKSDSSSSSKSSQSSKSESSSSFNSSKSSKPINSSDSSTSFNSSKSSEFPSKKYNDSTSSSFNSCTTSNSSSSMNPCDSSTNQCSSSSSKDFCDSSSSSKDCCDSTSSSKDCSDSSSKDCSDSSSSKDCYDSTSSSNCYESTLTGCTDTSSSSSSDCFESTSSSGSKSGPKSTSECTSSYECQYPCVTSDFTSSYQSGYNCYSKDNSIPYFESQEESKTRQFSRAPANETESSLSFQSSQSQVSQSSQSQSQLQPKDESEMFSSSSSNSVHSSNLNKPTPRGFQMRGKQGDKGDKGDKGDMGLPGPRGLRGERGPAGPTNSPYQILVNKNGPLKTIKEALLLAQPGDTVYVMGGVYDSCSMKNGVNIVGVGQVLIDNVDLTAGALKDISIENMKFRKLSLGVNQHVKFIKCSFITDMAQSEYCLSLNSSSAELDRCCLQLFENKDAKKNRSKIITKRVVQMSGAQSNILLFGCQIAVGPSANNVIIVECESQKGVAHINGSQIVIHDSGNNKMQIISHAAGTTSQTNVTNNQVAIRNINLDQGKIGGSSSSQFSLATSQSDQADRISFFGNSILFDRPELYVGDRQVSLGQSGIKTDLCCFNNHFNVPILPHCNSVKGQIRHMTTTPAGITSNIPKVDSLRIINTSDMQLSLYDHNVIVQKQGNKILLPYISGEEPLNKITPSYTINITSIEGRQILVAASGNTINGGTKFAFKGKASLHSFGRNWILL